MAYSDSGELYTWGYNTYSQLGNGNTNHTLTPSTVGGVLAGKTVVQVIDCLVALFSSYSLKLFLVVRSAVEITIA